MEGNEWRDNGDGTFTTLDESRRYGFLDQYLMGLRSAQSVGPLWIATNVEPLLTGATTFASTFGRTNNAVRDSAQNFGVPDHYVGFRMAFGSSTYLWSFSTVPITESGRTEEGPDPTVASTPINLKDYTEYMTNKSYSVRMVPDSPPQSRHFDSDTGKFTGDNIVFRAGRLDLSVTDIIEAEGERLPPVETSQKSFRSAFVLLVPRGKEPLDADIARVEAIRKGWEGFFSKAADGRATMSTSLAFGLSSVTEQLPAGAGRTYFSGGSEARTGYGCFEPGYQPGSALAILTSHSGNRVVSETAVAGTAALSRALWFVHKTAALDTGVAVAAPAANATVSLELRDASGKIVATSDFGISKGNQIARFVSELFSTFKFPAEFYGSLTLTSTSPVAVVSLRTLFNTAGEFLVTAIPVADLDAPAASGSLYMPQVADGGGYITEILLVNPGASVASGIVEFHAPDGSPLDVKVPGITAGSVKYRLEPHGSLLLGTDGAAASPRNGYLLLKPDGSQPPIAGAIFSLAQGGTVITATGVLATPAFTATRFPVNMSAGHDLALAAVNSSNQNTMLRLSLRDLEGRSLSCRATAPLPSRGQIATFLSQLFPTIPAEFRGTLEVDSDAAVAPVALRSLVADGRFLFCALPPDRAGEVGRRMLRTALPLRRSSRCSTGAPRSPFPGYFSSPRRASLCT
jgi:hypothetical protein